MHSKAFRRLKHKTQVFIAPEGDHYRTRLTHTLEASGIARNVARALGLNEDLTEAIWLGHDLGHPPFGHIGEAVLDECVRERWGSGFRHNEHSLRVVEKIEALNLTEQVRDGIRHHTGPDRPATLEGRIVKVVDRIAYINHDIDDAIRGRGAALRGPTARRRSSCSAHRLRAHRDAGGRPARRAPSRRATSCRARRWAARCCACARSCSSNVYLGADAQRETPRIERMLRALFAHYADNPPPPVVAGASEQERVIDWLAGMTDRFAIRAFSDLSVPQGF